MASRTCNFSRHPNIVSFPLLLTINLSKRAPILLYIRKLVARSWCVVVCMCPLQQPPLQNVNMQRASAGLAMFSSVVLDRALPLTLLHTNHRNTNKRTLAVCAPLHPCAAYNRTQYNRTTPTIVHPLALCEPRKHQSETDSVSPSTQRAMPN